MTYSKQELKQTDLEKEKYLEKCRAEIDNHTDEIKAEIHPENALLPLNLLMEKKKQEILDFAGKVYDDTHKIQDAISSFNQHKAEYLTEEELEHYEQDFVPFKETNRDQAQYDFDHFHPDPSKTIQQTIAFSDFSMYCLYTVAYNLLKHQNYKDAGNIFFLLCALNPTVKDHWIALGISMEEQKDYAFALRSYSAAFHNNHDPFPHLAAARCHLALNDLANAQTELSIANQYDKLNKEAGKWQIEIAKIHNKISQKK